MIVTVADNERVKDRQAYKYKYITWAKLSVWVIRVAGFMADLFEPPVVILKIFIILCQEIKRQLSLPN